MSFIRSISGLRATLGSDLTPRVVADHAAAFASILGAGPIVVGRDGRPSGHWMQDVVIGALRACGRTVHVLEMVPTPTVQLVVEHSTAAGGIVLTASHNPAEWNGMKFIGSDGVFIDAETNAQMWRVADDASYTLASEQQAGAVIPMLNAGPDHVQRVLAMNAVVRAPRASNTSVVVDAVNASASVVAPALLEAMGYTVEHLFTDGSGVFPHTPEPLEENLVELSTTVRKVGASLGVAIDPDGDRLVLFDEHGTAIGEERTIVLAVLSVLHSGVRGPVVVNYSTTRAVDDVARVHGCEVHRAPVGEINVVQRMRAVGAVIGGEGSGGVIYPECHAGRDSLVALGLITSYLRSTNQTLSQAVATLPQYEMVKTKIPAPPSFNIMELHSRLTEHVTTAHTSTEDGLHAAWSDRWVHVRVSNTEPIVRIIAEAPTAEDANQLISLVRRGLE